MKHFILSAAAAALIIPIHFNADGTVKHEVVRNTLALCADENARFQTDQETPAQIAAAQDAKRQYCAAVAVFQ